MTPEQKVNISGGNNQILPNATHAIQNMYNYYIGKDYIGKEQIGEILKARVAETSNSNEGEIVNMYYYSCTRPKRIDNEIIRKAILELCEKRLKVDNVLCLTGEEGIGLTTILSQFARRHATHCVSYFCNELEAMRWNPEVMEQEIVRQLYWYIQGKSENFNIATVDGVTIQSIYTKVLLEQKRRKQPLFFVFDGFDSVPSEKFETIKRIFDSLPWAEGRFIFTGNQEKLEKLFPQTSKLRMSNYEVIRFVDAEIKDYFFNADSSISGEQLETLCNITRGIPSRMETVLRKYVQTGTLQQLIDSDITGESDLFDDDFHKIFHGCDDDVKYFFALLAYTDFPLHVSVAAQILGMENDGFILFAQQYKEYVEIDQNEYVMFLHEGFHKYLRRKLTSLRQDVELKTLHVLELPEYMVSHSSFIPTLYKSLHQTEKLVAFLNKDNIQKILVDKKSQAALNEQCEFGYDACKEVPEKYAGPLFRFAVNQSMSREIERNELWDNELEALLAIGNVEQAMALAENVYMSEDKLKSFLLIARKKERLKITDFELLKERIDQLVSSIQFEKMPDKAIELAKLLFPIDYKAAIGIVDRVARENKTKVDTDRVYTLMSLMNNRQDDEQLRMADADIIDSKIENNELRSFASAAKSLFADVSVDVFLNALANLPSNSQKLHLLQIWLPEHEDKADIGKAVLKAISLIITVSDTEMPRARVLNDVCQSMSKMTEEEMRKAMSYIDALSDTIKYPTFDYVDAQLTIIEATKDKLPTESQELLEDLYLYVDDIEDQSIRLSCLSKLLGRFDYIGKKSVTENIIGASFELSEEIKQGIHQLMQETAYHLKVIEEPIKALVCGYTRLVNELIAEVNTIERKERAYSLAASQYLLRQNDEETRLDIFFDLLSKTSGTFGNREEPLNILTQKLLHSDKLNHKAALPLVKHNLYYIENLENCSQRVLFIVRLYLWMHKHFVGDSFANKLKTDIYRSWNAMSDPKYKIECGYFIAKNLAKVSLSDAEDILEKCTRIKQNRVLTSSSSCITAYDVSLELYVRSFSLMVRYKLCDDDSVHLFRGIMDDLKTESEKSIIWSRIALEYYCANNYEQFRDICNQYFPNNFDVYSRFDQKCIIYSLSPAMFLNSREALFALLDKYDESFRNDCIMHTLDFIICKDSALSGIGMSEQAYDLCYTDYQDIIALLEHASSDEVFFRVITVVALSLREGHPKKSLSTEHKKTIVNELARIVTTQLPTARGLQHDGYKIACEAALAHSQREFMNSDREEWENRIAGIVNNADRSFLYLFVAPYFQKRTDKVYFFNKGIKIAESISSTFDKVSRLDMSITECIDNNLGDLVQPVANIAMESLRANGSLQDYKRLVDMVYQHRPELAEEMVNNLDNDPTRIRYKQRLLDHITSTKKLEQAHKKLESIDNLTLKEQVKFFEKQLDELINGKGQIIEIKRLFSLTMQHIYSNSIENAKYAIIYVMEDLFRKYKSSNKKNNLLMSIHSTLRHNLKLVLSLSVGTKDRIDRVDTMIQTKDVTDDGYIQIGEEEKAWAYILNWYQKYNYQELYIIDPYFKPSDLHVIKQLCDINENLKINVLCHRQKFTDEDYLMAWNRLSSGVINEINLHFVWYKRKSTDGPLHDRYWICYDTENDEIRGLKVNSLDSLGKKESSMNEVDTGITTVAHNSYWKYALSRPSRVKGEEMEYSEVELD